MKRGEVWWADLPAPIGRRPVLIVTRSAVVPHRNQLVVAEITRTVRQIASEVPLSAADGMAKDCVVNCDVLLTVPKNRFLNQVTTLSPDRMSDVECSLKFALELS